MEQVTDEKCELCGSPLVLKWGKFGTFFACSAYNKKDPTSCTFTKENIAAKPDLNTPEAQEAGETEEYCENCGKVMVMRRGLFGPFMACPDYNADPPCKTFRKLSQKQQQKPPEPTGEDCPVCGKPLVLRQGAYGEFVSCSGYPKCKYVKQNLIEGMKCPKCGEGDMAERTARRGNVFWGCTNYPKCDFTSNLKPVAKKCPKCGSPYLAREDAEVGRFSGVPEQEEDRRGRGCGRRSAARKRAGCAEEGAKVVCTYSKRIGDAPPPPTAETHGPVVEKKEENRSCSRRKRDRDRGNKGPRATVRRVKRMRRAAMARLSHSIEHHGMTTGRILYHWQRRCPMERMLATPADAEIILKLYQLRTEAVMRQARAWVGGEFWPQTVDEFYAVYENPRDPHNPWLRQVLTYWEMAAAMVLHGAVSAELFVDCNGEGFFLLAKFAHILEAIREKNPTS